MARFDVYVHPDVALRKKTPYLLDVQNNFLDALESRIVIPMRHAVGFGPRMRDLHPEFQVAGKAVVLDTAALGAFPAGNLVRPVQSLAQNQSEILSALDALFGGY